MGKLLVFTCGTLLAIACGSGRTDSGGTLEDGGSVDGARDARAADANAGDASAMDSGLTLEDGGSADGAGDARAGDAKAADANAGDASAMDSGLTFEDGGSADAAVDGRAGDAAATDPHPCYPALNRNSLPFHTAPGPWGAQVPLRAPAEPRTSTEVSVSTWSAFKSNFLLGSRRIIVTAVIDAAGDNINASSSDVDVVINPGAAVLRPVFGQFGRGHTFERIRWRGPTPGTYSGGQLHYVFMLGWGYDWIFDGIGLTGPGGDSTNALEAGSNGIQRGCIVNTRIHSGASGLYGQLNHFLIANTSLFTGAELPRPPSGQDEAWGARLQGTGPVVLYQVDWRGRRYHRVRAHNGTGDNSQLLHVSHSTFLDLNEGRIFDTMDTASLTGNIAGAWFEHNTVYAVDGDGTRGLSLQSDRSNYASIRNNTGYGDIEQSDVSADNASSSVLTPNTWNAATSSPTWGAAGDPTGLDWTP